MPGADDEPIKLEAGVGRGREIAGDEIEDRDQDRGQAVSFQPQRIAADSRRKTKKTKNGLV